MSVAFQGDTSYDSIRLWCLTDAAYSVITPLRIAEFFGIGWAEAHQAILRAENDGALKPAGAGKWVAGQPAQPPRSGRVKALGDALALLIAEKFGTKDDSIYASPQRHQEPSYESWLSAIAALRDAGYRLPAMAGFSLRVREYGTAPSPKREQAAAPPETEG